jgi:hypothetical protein
MKRVHTDIQGLQVLLPFFFIQASKYAKMRERHDETLAKHEKTRQACEAVEEFKWKEAADFFYQAADVTCLVQEGNYHIVFVLDESGSMVRRWLCTSICVRIRCGCRRTRYTYTFADSCSIRINDTVNSTITVCAHTCDLERESIVLCEARKGLCVCMCSFCVHLFVFVCVHVSWAHADVFAASISVRVYLYVCATDMGMDVHACIMSAHTKINRESERYNTHMKNDKCKHTRIDWKISLS